MRRATTSRALAVFAILLVSSSFAQQRSTNTVPNLIRYGGTLRETNGAPISSATIGVTFAIYQQQDGGASIWMETQNVTTDAGGNYGVLLGSTTATGLPTDMFSQQEQRWLGVEVQGQPEQPRVLMVSVPYAFKAHEAETLGGKSVSDFVLATGASSSSTSAVQAAPAPANNLTSSGSNNAASDGPTNFSGSTTDQIVGVTQSGIGAGVKASAPTLGIIGTATAPNGTAYGVQGLATGTAGVGLIGTASSTTGFTYGLRGTSSSTSGTGVRGIDVATSGNTTGVSGYVDSPSGTAGMFTNAAGGKILVGQNNGATKFAVEGNGDLSISGNFTGSGTGITGITFSQLTGQLASSQFGGTYSGAVTLSNTGNSFRGSSFTGGTFTGSGSGLTGIPFANLSGTLDNAQFSGSYSRAVTLSNTSNAFYGNGANLTGVPVGSGSSYYIQNTTSPQNASFNINGSGTLSGSLSASAGLTGTSTTANGVYGQTAAGGGVGVYGANMASSGNAYGVAGYTNSTSTNASGVYGQASNGPGVYGNSTSAAGVHGQSSTGPGLSGTGFYGVIGNANTSANSVGVYGQSGSLSGYGVYGIESATSASAVGVYGQASNGPGVSGNSTSAAGVRGQSSTGPGVSGTGFYGVMGNANTTADAVGVYGQSSASDGYGVYGIESATSTNAVGVYGQSNNGPGVSGNSTSASGVRGQSSTGPGVSGSGFYGVIGNANTTANAVGVYGQSSAAGGAGVYGTSSISSGAGVYAVNTATTGAGSANGLYAESATGTAGYFVSDNLLLYGESQGNPAFYINADGSAQFNGFLSIESGASFAGEVTMMEDLHVLGTLTKGGGSFKIDDPLDPANKYLSHSFVESPDMKNIYDGIVHLDARGEAWVELPQYFEALNRDFRYQLTSVGASQPRLYIASEVKGNRFKIAGGKAGAKVSWQVTGIRQDAWANAHRIPNEEDKPPQERGTYLHPEVYGAAADKNTNALLQH